MGRSDEWPQDGSPTGGVGTITRPAGEPTTDPVAEPGEGRGRRPAAAPAAPPRRTHRPRRPSRAPKGAPPDDTPASRRGAPPDDRGARSPATSDEGRGRAQAPRRRAGASRASGTNRVPFFLVVCGLLGGALICALVISTTLAEGSFQITRLQQANTSLAKQRQLLAEQVEAAQSAQVIQARALQLGMRPVGEVRFLNLKTGKVQTDAGSGAVAGHPRSRVHPVTQRGREPGRPGGPAGAPRARRPADGRPGRAGDPRPGRPGRAGQAPATLRPTAAGLARRPFGQATGRG